MSRKRRLHGPHEGGGTKGPRHPPGMGKKTNVGDPNTKGIKASLPQKGAR